MLSCFQNTRSLTPDNEFVFIFEREVLLKVVALTSYSRIVVRFCSLFGSTEINSQAAYASYSPLIVISKSYSRFLNNEMQSVRRNLPYIFCSLVPMYPMKQAKLSMQVSGNLPMINESFWKGRKLFTPGVL